MNDDKKQRQQVKQAGGNRGNGLGQVTGNLGRLDAKNQQRARRPGTRRRPSDEGGYDGGTYVGTTRRLDGKPTRHKYYPNANAATPSERRSHREVFATALSLLTPDQRAVWGLREGLVGDHDPADPEARKVTFQVIASVLGLSPAVARRLWREANAHMLAIIAPAVCERDGCENLIPPTGSRFCSKTCRNTHDYQARKARARADSAKSCPIGEERT